MFGLTKHRRRFIQQYVFPDPVRRRLERELPGLTPSQYDQVFEGLRDWFAICLGARHRKTFVAMPSMAVDEAWHTFILFTRDYTAFCQAAFGGYLHHHPEESLGDARSSLMSDGMVATFIAACTLERREMDGTWLPHIFALDKELTLPGGLTHDAPSMVEAAKYEGLKSSKVSYLGTGTGGYAGYGGDSGGGGGGCGGGGCGGGCGGG